MLGQHLSLCEREDIHLVITGGEPLMPHAQECTTEIMKCLIMKANFPASITFETNGTQELTPELIEEINVYKLPVHWSISRSRRSFTFRYR